MSKMECRPVRAKEALRMRPGVWLGNPLSIPKDPSGSSEQAAKSTRASKRLQACTEAKGERDVGVWSLKA